MSWSRISARFESVVVGDATIYKSQLRNLTEAPAHRFQFGLPLLASLPISEAMRPALRSLTGSLQSLRSIFSGSPLVEDEVGPASAMSGRTIAKAPWPSGTVVVAIQRGDKHIFPEPGNEVLVGDVLSALVPKNVEDRL